MKKLVLTYSEADNQLFSANLLCRLISYISYISIYDFMLNMINYKYISINKILWGDPDTKPLEP